MENILAEAFRQLHLTEEAFDISVDAGKVDELKSFVADDVPVEEEEIIDTTANDEDELQDSYEGMIILECPACRAKIFKDQENITITDDVANADDKCPVCANDGGFKILGKVAKFEEEKPEEATEEEDEDPTEATEPLAERLARKHLVKESVENEPIPGPWGNLKDDEKEEDACDESLEVTATDEENVEVTKDDEGNVTISTAAPIEEGTEEIVPLTDEEQEEIEHNDDEEATEEEVAEKEVAEEEVPEEEEVNDEATEEEATEESDVVDEVPEEVNDEATEEVDELPEEGDEVEDLDAESIDELGEAFLNQVYSNVKSFKSSDIKLNEDSIIVEGLISYKSSKERPTTFVFTEAKLKPNGKVVLEGYNKTFSKGNKTFFVAGHLIDNKLIAESLVYRYSLKMLNEGVEKTTKVYGRVTRK